MNEVRLRVQLVGRAVLRFTPAGVPALEATLHHRGTVSEAGLPRTLDFEFEAIALGRAAERLNGAALGCEFDCTGFIAPRSKRTSRLRIHIDTIEPVTGV
ncbi:MAG: primosomal replication protein N [Betaproteobacteria bacterium]